MQRVAIIPTGDEIAQGIVIDTNSPALMEIILEKFPRANVERISPVPDDQKAIKAAIERYADYDLIILIGGSGGGKYFDSDLAEDQTHLTLAATLSAPAVKSIYGYNGHLWSRLVVGRIHDKALVANVPGPFVEAIAAGRALVSSIAEGVSLGETSERVAQAVLLQYPDTGGLRCV